jgi:hypothetical protein
LNIGRGRRGRGERIKSEFFDCDVSDNVNNVSFRPRRARLGTRKKTGGKGCVRTKYYMYGYVYQFLLCKLPCHVMFTTRHLRSALAHAYRPVVRMSLHCLKPSHFITTHLRYRRRCSCTQHIPSVTIA